MSSEEASSSGLSLQGVNDVEDFLWENEEESMSWERFSHLYDLMQMGNTAFRANRFEEAISCYSKAYIIKPNDPVILRNRCTAYIRICQFLRQRQSSESENRPLSGLDPTIHAGLALKDAEKLMNLRNSSLASYILKADSLILLEKFEQAHDVILSGLQVDPLSTPLQNLAMRTSSTIGRRSHGITSRSDDFDCTLCLKLLYEPLTTPCGHSFCRSCLFQAMDRCNRCPLCRTVLFISPRTCSISVTLNNIIQRNFPVEYAERKLENDSLTNMGVNLIPLFVMDVVLPCQKLQLNIFEARYRLMVRRIMEGNRRMGMVITDPTSGLVADLACEVEITECEPLPDGRFFLEVESRRRFRILNHWEQDGYRVAEIEWVQDVCPADGTREKAELQEMTNKAAAYARSWLKASQAAARGDQMRLSQLFKAEGLMPSTRDPERFSFWLTTLTNRRPDERLNVLRMRDTIERLRYSVFFMQAEEEGWRVR